MPEYLIGIMITAALGWGGFTWRKAEDAITRAIKAICKIDNFRDTLLNVHKFTPATFDSFVKKSIERFH